ncbi:MAG: tetratricopeptide repeat protein [Promethearchaeota archaeon]
MSNTEPQELIIAKKLIEQNKYGEAFQVLSDFDQNGENNLSDKISCLLLQCQILFWQGDYKDVILLAKKIYKKSLELGKTLQSVDALIFIIMALVGEGKLNLVFGAIKKADDLLKTLKKKSPDYIRREATISWYLGASYAENKGMVDEGLKYVEQSLKLREEIGHKQEISESILEIGYLLGVHKGELDKAIGLLKQALVLAEESNDKYTIVKVFYVFHLIYYLKGELDDSLSYIKRCLVLYKEFNNKAFIAWSFYHLAEIYRMKGDLKSALKYIKKSIALSEELENKRLFVITISTIIKLNLDNSDAEGAWKYLQRLEQFKDHVGLYANLLYRLSKVKLLKTSLSVKNRVKAEKILKMIIKESTSHAMIRIEAQLELCNVLLNELRFTNNIKVLDKINYNVDQLIKFSESSNSFNILAETYLLQAKISLISINIGEAQRHFIQALQIAERHGLNRLSKKISTEYKKLLNQLTLWEQLKELNVSINKRMDLAKISEQMNLMLRNRQIIYIQTSEDKITIQKERKICLVCKGEIVGFTYVCECDTIYCENCAKALTNFENVCWVCNAPIDKSRPTKPYMKDEMEKEMKISEKSQK